MIPEVSERTRGLMDWLTPRQVVAELDRYVIGQHRAKRAVAVALRNRWRRQQAPAEAREDIVPTNILMMGPTGVGKTEIARRLARLVRAPFLKVEASKFTEVGYVGRDVESMIRDLADIAVDMVRAEWMETRRDEAARVAEERLLDLLLPHSPSAGVEAPEAAEAAPPAASGATREKLRRLLREGKLEERTVELEPRPPSAGWWRVMRGGGSQGNDLDRGLEEMLGGLLRSRQRRRPMNVREARHRLEEEAAESLLDMERVAEEALRRMQESGIVFIDEVDKIAGRGQSVSGPDVSRGGVQRDLLPLVEGCTVSTRHGMVKTDHILFIAAGAFHGTKPSDLIPELQGRFPIRVELDPLGAADFARILTEPRNALLEQARLLLAADGVELRFAPEAVTAMAEIAAGVNARTEDIGARRLQTVLSALLEELAFDAPYDTPRTVNVDRAMVEERLGPIVHDEDLSRYIL